MPLCRCTHVLKCIPSLVPSRGYLGDPRSLSRRQAVLTSVPGHLQQRAVHARAQRAQPRGRNVNNKSRSMRRPPEPRTASSSERWKEPSSVSKPARRPNQRSAPSHPEHFLHFDRSLGAGRSGCVVVATHYCKLRSLKLTQVHRAGQETWESRGGACSIRVTAALSVGKPTARGMREVPNSPRSASTGQQAPCPRSGAEPPSAQCGRRRGRRKPRVATPRFPSDCSKD